MQVTLHLPSSLKIARDITVDVNSYQDVVSAVVNLLPDIKQRLKQKSLFFIVDGDKLITKAYLQFKPKSKDLHVIESVFGGLNGFDSLGNLNIFYGSSNAISNQTIPLTGLAKRITESSLFGQSQTAFDAIQRQKNRSDGLLENIDDPTSGFGSIASISAFGTPVPFHFGMVRTSGAVISSYVKHIQRGGIDNIRVSDYVQ